MKKIAIIGISEKPNMKPLDLSSNTGKVIQLIEQQLPDVEIYKTNLVRFAPMGEDGKIRYPTTKEIEDSIPELLRIIEQGNFNCVVCLGEKVSKALSGKVSKLISIHHPSYMWVYRRKGLLNYIDNAVLEIKQYLCL